MKNKFFYIILFSIISLTAGAKAKYVFYFIGDGMGMGHVFTTETYRRDILKTDNPLLMLSFPVASQVMTYSYNSPITDSAAAGTALSTGWKTNNSMVGMAPDTTAVYSISRDFMNAGYAVGVVTSVAGDDATPAAFYAHVAGRSESALIGQQAMQSGIQFLGAPAFKAMKDKNSQPTNWEMAMQRQGRYTLIKSYQQYEQLPDNTAKILMLSDNPQGQQSGYTLDSIPATLTLQELTATCLEHLYSPSSPGFFMMAEAGNIDWAAHANDGGAVVKEILNFQNAIKIAYDFYLQHPDETLIVVTADHDTGGMSTGRDSSKTKVNLKLIDYQKISKDRFADNLRDYIKQHHNAPAWNELKRELEEKLSFGNKIPLSETEWSKLENAYNKTFIQQTAGDEKTLYNNYQHFTEEVFSLLNEKYGIGFTSHSHTGNPVPLYAIGAGSELFGHTLNNTEIPRLILEAAGLKR